MYIPLDEWDLPLLDSELVQYDDRSNITAIGVSDLLEDHAGGVTPPYPAHRVQDMAIVVVVIENPQIE